MYVKRKGDANCPCTKVGKLSDLRGQGGWTGRVESRRARFEVLQRMDRVLKNINTVDH